MQISKVLYDKFEQDSATTPSWNNVYKHSSKQNVKDWVKDFFDKTFSLEKSGEPYSIRRVMECLVEDNQELDNPFSHKPFAVLVWCGPNNSDVKLMATQAEEALGSNYLFEEITGDIITNRDAEVFAKSVLQKAKKENKSGVFFFSANMASRSFFL